MKLRSYQQEIHDATIDYLWENPGKNGVVCSPGGTGKTLTMNATIRTLVTKWPGTRVLSMVHDATVIDQNVNSMLKYWENAPVGVYSAGLRSRDTIQPIIYGGIQSAAKRYEEFGNVNIVLIDECDMVSPKENTLYQKFLDGLREQNPNLRVVGYTATPFRLGVGLITNLDMWDDVIVDFTRAERFMWFVDNGFLAPLINKKAAKEIDVTNISMRGGDFDEKEMQEAADTDELNRSVVDEMIRYGSDRKHWLLFSAGVKHGHRLTKLLNSKGVPTIMLTGEDSRDVREKGESDFRKGIYRCLVNVGLYGRGYDFPNLDLIGVARATQSTAWWLQAIKRGTRVAKGKTDCLVLDFASNTLRLGPVNLPNIPAPRRKGQAVAGDAPIKICPQCFSYVPIQVRTCPDCQYEFPPPQTIQKTASEVAIMARTSKQAHIAEIEDFRVTSIRYKPTVSKRGANQLKITYGVGTANFYEYLSFDSSNAYLARRARIWWEYRGGKQPIPDSVDDAADRSGELLIPTIIRVDIAGKYPEVVGADFDEDAKTQDELDSDEPF